MKDIKFAKMDGDKYEDFAESLQIRKMPTLKMYIYGVPLKYDKKVTMSGIRKWIDEISKLQTKYAQEFSDLGTTDLEVYYTSKEGSDLDHVMLGFSKKHKEVGLFKVSKKFAEQLFTKYSLNKTLLANEDLLFIRRKHDSYSSVYSG